MANTEGFDSFLSLAMKKAAQANEETAAQAEAHAAEALASIRERLQNFETGTTVTGPVAPGWGSSVPSWLPWISPIVLAGVLGGALGASGLLGGSAGPSGGDIPAYVNSSETAAIYSCPGGPQVGTIPASTRVLAVARDADGAFLGARDPSALTTTVWFETGDLILDADSPDPASLPVEECPEVTVTLVTPPPAPEPTETTPPDDGNNNPPPPPSDTTAPTQTKMTANPTLVINEQSSQISINASDNVGVTGVALSWSGPNGITGSAPMVLTSGTWRYTWSYANMSNGFGNWTFTARASDAAGNLSAPAQVVVNRQYLG
jgi:hypothetical protein